MKRLISKAEYQAHLTRLVREIVRKHGEMTVGELHQRVNRFIVAHGVDGDHRHA